MLTSYSYMRWKICLIYLIKDVSVEENCWRLSTPQMLHFSAVTQALVYSYRLNMPIPIHQYIWPVYKTKYRKDMYPNKIKKIDTHASRSTPSCTWPAHLGLINDLTTIPRYPLSMLCSLRHLKPYFSKTRRPSTVEDRAHCLKYPWIQSTLTLHKMISAKTDQSIHPGF